MPTLTPVYALGDIGGTESRLTLVTQEGIQVGEPFTAPTDPKDYEVSMGRVVDLARESESHYNAQIIAGSLAIAATPDGHGKLIIAGDLHPWIGEYPAIDLAMGLDLDTEAVGVLNDVVAIAKSQQSINEENGRRVNGIAGTLSTGVNVANYYADGRLEGDEAGHVTLEGATHEGATCTCQGIGHVEAYFSGKGREINNGGMKLRDWLLLPGNQDEFVADGVTALVQLLERHRTDREFEAEEIVWTGSVALRQPFMMRRIAKGVRDAVREQRGEDYVPAFDVATMLDQAGLHGTFADAHERAQAA